ncbi:MAG: hypothetical protein FJY81_03545 [Candidatus Aminicenantes bacterium]|nr:hypothetical protein [Candidatus Aminicenantes bacterium]
MKNLHRDLQRISFIVCFMFLIINTATPCTVAVVSGKATADGKPLLWKNRDASAVNNKMIYAKGPKYAFIGLINASDSQGSSVWAGINTEGFAIMNAASSDLADDEKGGDGNGKFMRLALGECASAADFEALLLRTSGQRQVAANFGLIDAEGNACFYETGKANFVKLDANDRRFAPFGYIVRTNYAFTAPEKFKGGGYIRFERISRLFEKALAEGRLDVKFILLEAARDLVNEKLHSYPLTQPLPSDPARPLYVNTNDTINRNSTVSVAVFHGAASREKAFLATMWVMLGRPVCSVAVPLWACVPEIPAPVGGSTTAPLNDLAKSIAAYLYPDKRGHMTQYLNVTRLRNYGGEGVLPKLLRIENEAISRTESKRRQWEKSKPDPNEVAEFEASLAAWVLEAVKNSFPDLLPGK